MWRISYMWRILDFLLYTLPGTQVHNAGHMDNNVLRVAIYSSSKPL